MSVNPVAGFWVPDPGAYPGPRYLAIVRSIRDAISTGQLKPGDRLAPQREMAWALRLNLSTITEAYREAARQHLVAGEVGRGTFVLANSAEAALYDLKATRDGFFDLSTNVPVSNNEFCNLSRDLTAVLLREPDLGKLSYCSADVLLRSKLAIASWFGHRHYYPGARQIFPCPGAQHALHLALDMLTQPGDAVLVEELSFPGLRSIARQLGILLYPVKLDDQGVIPEDLGRAVRASGAKIVVLQPVSQNPTGATMGEQRRTDVQRILNKHKLHLIEEDVYGDFGTHPPLIASYGQRGVLVGGFSKSVAPGVRFGFLIMGEGNGLPDPAIERTSWSMAPLMMALVTFWLENGTARSLADWQIREAIARHSLGRNRLAKMTKSPSCPSLHVWWPLHNGDEFANIAARAGVSIVPASYFSYGRHAPQGVRLCLTAPDTRSKLSEALTILTDIYCEYQQK